MGRRSRHKARSTNYPAGLLRAGGSRIKWILATGAPWEEILNAIKDEDVDLVVMGTHGRRGVAHALLGSFAEKTVRFRLEEHFDFVRGQFTDHGIVLPKPRVRGPGFHCWASSRPRQGCGLRN